MRRIVRISAICALAVLSSLSTFAQTSPMVGTVVDLDEGRNRLQIELDDASQTRVAIETDAVSTAYYGFGTSIAGKPEIFTGSAGLSNVRVGDRIQVRGSARSEGVFRADQVTLLGRTITATTTGVGQTRAPESASTPTTERPVGSGATQANRIEGTIRQINEDEGRLVIQTTDRRMLTVRTYRNTPVWYRGDQYRVSNLEIGDRILVEADARGTAGDEITARRIDVTQSVQDTGTGTGGTGANVTMLQGRVTRVEPGLDYAYVNDGRNEVRVDMSQAEDASGNIIRARDLRVGDNVEISGSYNRVGDMFLASTVRTGTGTGRTPLPDTTPDVFTRYGVVTITGTVSETLEDGPSLGFRDRDTNSVLRIWVTNNFVVRTRGNTYTTAENLRVNDTAVIEAFRDLNGNLIAQTIRLRNR